MKINHAVRLALPLLLVGGPALAAAPQPGVYQPGEPAASALEPRPGQQRAARDSRRHRDQVDLVIESISPKAPGPASTVVLRGQVVNHSGQPITGMIVRLRFSTQALISRGQLAQYSGAAAPPLPAEISNPQRFQQALGPGGKQQWQLTTTAKDLRLGGFGVYPLSVEVDDLAGRILSAQRTFLTFVPGNYRKILKPTKIAWIWPLMDQPRRTINNEFRDDRLATDLAQGGRLNGLVAAAQRTKTPLTWSIDPALLDDAQVLSNPYAVKGARKPKSDAAASWLADVKAASAGEQYFTTPYADPDVVALIRNGRSGDLKVAYQSMSVARDVLGRDPTGAVAWPADGVADQRTLSQLSRNGSNTFLLSSDVLPAVPNLTFTPSAAIPLQTARDPKYAIAYDSTLTAIVGGDTRSPGAAVLTEQRFLAETAMITAERPSLQRTLVVAPPRRWNPGQGAATRLLADTSAARWLQPVTLPTVVKAPAVERAFAGYPAAYQAHELGAVYLKSVHAIETDAVRFSQIFQPPLTGYQLGILRLESSAWRGRGAALRARIARKALTSRLAGDRSLVRFVVNKGPGLAGETGQVPVTISNDMAGHTITVYLDVRSAYPARLQIGRFEPAVTIGPEKKVTVLIPMKALANGKTDVHLTLQSQRRKQIGIARTIRVNATGYGRRGLLITGSALAVLFLGIGIRVMRARRRNGVEGADGHGIDRSRSAAVG